MAFVLNDRVFETTTTTGTGTLNLGGAPASYQSFVDGIGDGNTCFYVITNDTDWETGIGTVTSGAPDTLSRDTVYQSSNVDAKVNFGSGIKNVYVANISHFIVTENKDNTFTGTNTFSNPITIDEVTYTGTDGTAGQFLTTDGAGSASFADVPEFDPSAQPIVTPADNDYIVGTDTSDGDASVKFLKSDIAATAQLAKAWVNFNGTGTVAIRDSYNVSSITDTGTGRYTVNFANDFNNLNYFGVVSAGDPDIANFNVYGGFPGNSAPTVSAAPIFTQSDSNTPLDAEYVSAVFYGDLA